MRERERGRDEEGGRRAGVYGVHHGRSVPRSAHIKRVIESFYEANNANGNGKGRGGERAARRNGNSLAQSIKRDI